MPGNALREPWRSFLLDLDRQLERPTELHCFGGFVVAECYGLTRTTADIDVLVGRAADATALVQLAGRNSPLHQRHKVYLDVVTIATVPDNYEERLTPADGLALQNLRLLVFERHDLVLGKLSRNIDRDRDDVVAIAAGPGLDVAVLRERYKRELRFQLGRPEREDLTLALWIEIIQEIQQSRS